MSGRLARLDACSPKEKDDALAFLSGYSPEAFDRCMLHVERFRKPPKPIEPKGLGAVVEDSGHRLWVRVSNTPGTFPWLRDGEGVRGWSEFDAVRVLSDGVES